MTFINNKPLSLLHFLTHGVQYYENDFIFATKTIKKMAKIYMFKLGLKVRDYECDLQGIVNNANYQHYMEHARHEFLETLGANFGKLHEEGIDAVVSRVVIDYKTSLRSGDSFYVGVNIEREGVKLVFFQDIYRTSDNQICAKGRVESVCLEQGKLTRGELFDKIFKDYLPRHN